MKIESNMNHLSVADRQPVKQREDMHTQEQRNTQKANEAVRMDAHAVSRTDKAESAVQSKVEPKERVEMSSNEMKVRTKSVKTNQAQDAVSAQQVAEHALSSMKQQGQALKELSSKHQEAKPEEKLKIEKQAKEILVKMKETSDSATFKGRNVLGDKLDAKVAVKLEKVDMKELLKPENVEKAITKPLEEASKKATAQTEQMVASLSASQVVPMTKTEANQSMQRVKEALKESEPRKIASGLDSRRANIAHLLK